VRLYRELKEELARPFGESSVIEAVAHCIDRDAEFVREYLDANFELDAQAELPPAKDEPKPPDRKPETGEGHVEPEAGSENGELTPDDAGETGEEAEDELSPDGDEGEEALPKQERPAKPKAPTFMDRYAKSRSFRWHEEERCYTHANGAWIERGE